MGTIRISYSAIPSQSSDLASSAMETLNEKSEICVSAVNGTGDREAYPKYWYAAQVRSCCEKKVANKLNGLGVETYVPFREEIRQWSDRKKKISVVLIPMVVFLHIEPDRITEVQQLSFVYEILKYPGQKSPAIIPTEQIDCLKSMIRASNGQIDFNATTFNAGDHVIVWKGKLQGLSGKIKEDSTGKVKIRVIIDLLGSATAEISVSDLKILTGQ